MTTPGKLSEAEYENGKRIIQSEKLAIMEFREMDNILNGGYSRLLSHAK